MIEFLGVLIVLIIIIIIIFFLIVRAGDKNNIEKEIEETNQKIKLGRLQ